MFYYYFSWLNERRWQMLKAVHWERVEIDIYWICTMNEEEILPILVVCLYCFLILKSSGSEDDRKCFNPVFLRCGSDIVDADLTRSVLVAPYLEEPMANQLIKRLCVLVLNLVYGIYSASQWLILLVYNRCLLSSVTKNRHTEKGGHF